MCNVSVVCVAVTVELEYMKLSMLVLRGSVAHTFIVAGLRVSCIICCLFISRTA